uniref:Uncharacterized protein MANES_13G136500 n=1 Tax=Rhizophora mucronata TaxID=61149 RepID=A0A2P2JE63_RHIMU
MDPLAFPRLYPSILKLRV